MRHPLPFAWLCATALAVPTAAAAIPATVTVLQHTGPSEDRIDLLIVGEGYRDVDQMQMRGDAAWLLAQLFSYEPWSDYEELFNLALLEVVSNERGADNGTYGAEVDTAFDAIFGCGGSGRGLCADDGKVLAAAAEHYPAFDYVLVMVNDPKRGGTGGGIAVFSISTDTGLITHEVGHTLAGLADEYATANPGFSPCIGECHEPNVTPHDALDGLKWAAWVEPGTPIPSPAGTPGVGLFEGARYQEAGIYRPAEDCMMRALEHDLCPVCKEAHVHQFIRSVGLIQHPTATPPSAGSCDDELEFRVKSPPLEPDAIEYLWWVGDRVPDAGDHIFDETGPTLRVLRSELPFLGLGEIQVQARYQSDYVRTDRYQDMVDSWAFQAVGVGGECSNPCVTGIRCSQWGGCVPELAPDGALCGEPLCADGGVATPQCIAGACEEMVRSCAPYICVGDPAFCRDECRSDGECVAGFRCVDRVCQLRPAPGVTY